mmetsp:Transcript_59921/g.160442  ORF Transcript_59921/g.160442 Transcript_59921/m.160442 type:complete len:448 (-) Transcript_59921:351-1694(-)
MPVTLTKQATITAALGKFLQAIIESGETLPGTLNELSDRWTVYYQEITGEHVTCPLGTIRYYLRCRGVVVRRSGTLRWKEDQPSEVATLEETKPELVRQVVTANEWSTGAERRCVAVRYIRHMDSTVDGIAQIVSVLQQAGGALPLCGMGGRVRWTRDQRFRLGRLTRFISDWPRVFESSEEVVRLTAEAQEISQEPVVIASWAVRHFQAEADIPNEHTQDSTPSATTHGGTESAAPAAAPELHLPGSSGDTPESFSMAGSSPRPASDSVRWADLMTTDEDVPKKKHQEADLSAGETTDEEEEDEPPTPRSTASDGARTLVLEEPQKSTYVRQETIIYVLSGAGHRPANGEYIQTPALSGGYNIYRKRIRGMRRPWQPYYLYCYPVDNKWYVGRTEGSLGDSGTEDFYVLSAHPSARPEAVPVGEQEGPAPSIMARTVQVARKARED